MSLPQPSESFAWTQEPWGPALQCLPLRAVAPHLFTSGAISVTRDPADLALGAVATSLRLTPEAIMQVHQVHGCSVVKFDRQSGNVAKTDIRPDRISADALVTDDPDRAVGVRVADCVPILLSDRAGRAVAAVHGGWRGTAAGIVRFAVEALRTGFGLEPEHLLVALGPSIRACCYEVGPEVRDQFKAAGHPDAVLAGWFSPGERDRLYLDVARANVDQLQALGIPRMQIFDSGLCTAHNGGIFPSYRRQGAAAGRMLAVIRVRGSGENKRGSA
jgi:YfiH family protein